MKEIRKKKRKEIKTKEERKKKRMKERKKKEKRKKERKNKEKKKKRKEERKPWGKRSHGSGKDDVDELSPTFLDFINLVIGFP